jgi:hypothetical protein
MPLHIAVILLGLAKMFSIVGNVDPLNFADS